MAINRSDLNSKDFTRAEKAMIHSLAKLLKDSSFDKLSITTLLKDCGYTKGAFYGRFEDKYDFVKKIVTHFSELYCLLGSSIEPLTEDGDMESLIAEFTELFEFLYEYRDLLELVFDSKIPYSEDLLKNHANAIMMQIVENREDEICLPPYCDRILYNYISISITFSLMKFWRFEGYSCSCKDMARRNIYFFPDLYKRFFSGFDKWTC